MPDGVWTVGAPTPRAVSGTSVERIPGNQDETTDVLKTPPLLVAL